MNEYDKKRSEAFRRLNINHLDSLAWLFLHVGGIATTLMLTMTLIFPAKAKVQPSEAPTVYAIIAFIGLLFTLVGFFKYRNIEKRIEIEIEKI